MIPQSQVLFGERCNCQDCIALLSLIVAPICVDNQDAHKVNMVATWNDYSSASARHTFAVV